MVTYILLAILLLGFLILIHEFGHFVFCKIFKVKVLRFSIGFGPAIARIKKGDTEYRISPILFGGYVKPLAKEEVERIEYDLKRLGKSEEEIRKFFFEMGIYPNEVDKRAIDVKPYWQRIIVIMSGALFNFISGMLFLYIMLVAVGDRYTPSIVGRVKEGSPAFLAGITEGDKILEINGEEIKRWTDLKIKILSSEKVNLKIQRGEKIFEVSITPQVIDGERLIGISPTNEVVVEKYPPLPSILFTIERTIKTIKYFFLGIKLALQRGKLEVAGPVGITKITAEALEHSISDVFIIAFILSINLAIINLLPIPLLDGGNIVFYLIEFISRRRFSWRAKDIYNVIGLIFVITIAVFILMSDLMMILKK